jgi:hypothetical protein
MNLATGRSHPRQLGHPSHRRRLAQMRADRLLRGGPAARRAWRHWREQECATIRPNDNSTKRQLDKTTIRPPQLVQNQRLKG